MKKAFTLIELLIVVAIIAILAAIAVPNFLEAQTRAKVVQQRANMRSIVTALEAYRTDHNGALPATANNYGWAHRWHFWERLTTPVPYMTSVPQDIFFRQWGLPNAQFGYGVNYYYDYPLWDHNIIHALLKNPRGSAPGIWGPISASDLSTLRGIYIGYLEPAFHLWNQGGASFMLRGWSPKWDNQVYNFPYDPTNGTISDGHIFVYN